MQMNGDHMTSPGLRVTRVSHQGLLPPLHPLYLLSSPVQFSTFCALVLTLHSALQIVHFFTQCNLGVDHPRTYSAQTTPLEY